MTDTSTSPDKLRDQLAEAFAKTAAAHRRRLGPFRWDLADAALETFDADAQRQHVQALMNATRLRSMQIRDGGFEMDIDAARELTTEYVAAARTMLGDAENYSETPVEFTVGLAGQERYVLIVQRAGKLTPHQARKRAEAERDSLRERIAADCERRARYYDHPEIWPPDSQSPDAIGARAMRQAWATAARLIREGEIPADLITTGED